MTGAEARRRLSDIKPGEERRLSALANDIVAAARQPSMMLVQEWSAGDAAGKGRVENVLTEMAELSVSGWLNGAVESGAGQDASAVVFAGRATAACLAVQQRLIGALRAMMDSMAPAPRPPSAHRSEEREPPSRECDEAYLLARWLMKVSEPGLDRAMARKRFLALSPAQRNAEIASFRKSGQFCALEERGADEGEKP